MTHQPMDANIYAMNVHHTSHTPSSQVNKRRVIASDDVFSSSVSSTTQSNAHPIHRPVPSSPASSSKSSIRTPQQLQAMMRKAGIASSFSSFSSSSIPL